MLAPGLRRGGRTGCTRRRSTAAARGAARWCRRPPGPDRTAVPGFVAALCRQPRAGRDRPGPAAADRRAAREPRRALLGRRRLRRAAAPTTSAPTRRCVPRSGSPTTCTTRCCPTPGFAGEVLLGAAPRAGASSGSTERELATAAGRARRPGARACCAAAPTPPRPSARPSTPPTCSTACCRCTTTPARRRSPPSRRSTTWSWCTRVRCSAFHHACWPRRAYDGGIGRVVRPGRRSAARRHPVHAADGERRWPVVDGIPCLRAGRDEVRERAVAALDAGDADGARGGAARRRRRLVGRSRRRRPSSCAPSLGGRDPARGRSTCSGSAGSATTSPTAGPTRPASPALALTAAHLAAAAARSSSSPAAPGTCCASWRCAAHRDLHRRRRRVRQAVAGAALRLPRGAVALRLRRPRPRRGRCRRRRDRATSLCHDALYFLDDKAAVVAARAPARRRRAAPVLLGHCHDARHRPGRASRRSTRTAGGACCRAPTAYDEEELTAARRSSGRLPRPGGRRGARRRPRPSAWPSTATRGRPSPRCLAPAARRRLRAQPALRRRRAPLAERAVGRGVRPAARTCRRWPDLPRARPSTAPPPRPAGGLVSSRSRARAARSVDLAATPLGDAPVRWGIVGCGWVARDHAAARRCRATPRRALVGACTTVTAAAARAPGTTARRAHRRPRRPPRRARASTPSTSPRPTPRTARGARPPPPPGKPGAVREAAGRRRRRRRGDRRPRRAGRARSARRSTSAATPPTGGSRELVAAGELGTVTAVRIVYGCWLPADWSPGRRAARQLARRPAPGPAAAR